MGFVKKIQMHLLEKLEKSLVKNGVLWMKIARKLTKNKMKKQRQNTKKLLQLTKRQENMLLIKKVLLLGNKQKKQQRKLKQKKTTKRKLLREKNKFLYIYLKKTLSVSQSLSLFFFLSRGQTLRVISEETIQEGSGIYGASQRCPFFTRGCIPLRLNKLYKVCVHIIQ